jgi:hypothetical protein
MSMCLHNVQSYVQSYSAQSTVVAVMGTTVQTQDSLASQLSTDGGFFQHQC